MNGNILTLLTDFGLSDYYVAAMKGAIVSADPRIPIVDLSHEVQPHDVLAAGFLLSAVYRDFPPGTVHVVVVDPGVGSARAPIAVRAAGRLFVGPDNGVFSPVLEVETEAEVRRIETLQLRRPTISPTFHGRDLFAPAAAALATGFPFDDVGPLAAQPVMREALRLTTRPRAPTC